MATAALTAGAYSIGASRGFGYDAAVTVHNFVATPSFADAVTRQVVFNNHPLFSLLEHAVCSMTGSADEVVMRIAPIGFAALTVALLTYVLANRLGLVPAISAAALVATNPLFVSVAREPRGYSLVTFAALASTVLLLRLENGHRRRGAALGYVVALAAGLATNMYMALVLVGHVLYLTARRAVTGSWRTRWLTALLLGCGAHAAIIDEMLAAARLRSRHFQPGFPMALMRDVLGGPMPAVVLVLLLVLAGIRPYRGSAVLTRLTVAGGAFLFALWLYGPRDLYTRLFVWAIPAVAAAVAVAVARRPRLAALVLVAVVLNLASQVEGFSRDALANRAAAEAIEDRGLRICGLGFHTEALQVYVKAKPIYVARDLVQCDVAVALAPAAYPQLVVAAENHFSRHIRLNAESPGLLFTDPRP